MDTVKSSFRAVIGFLMQDALGTQATVAEITPGVISRFRRWRMPEVEAYDIRHTISTLLDKGGVPGAQISGITGHLPSSRGVARTTSKHYLHYDPRNAPEAVAVLTTFFDEVARHADLWAADHLRTIATRGKPIALVPRSENG